MSNRKDIPIREAKRIVHVLSSSTVHHIDDTIKIQHTVLDVYTLLGKALRKRNQLRQQFPTQQSNVVSRVTT